MKKSNVGDFQIITDVNITNIFIGIIASFTIPVIYAKIQKMYKKKSLKKFLKVIKKDVVHANNSSITASDYRTLLDSAINKLSKIDSWVLSVYDEDTFHTYISKLEQTTGVPHVSSVSLVARSCLLLDIIDSILSK